ncbi:response regulator (plasmid) [Legionella adelaidensis]|uniref:Response regulator n=1 Tax=Legionella adelaidensis TaxID=45056 RepID=A0A0W0R2J4_9GAMM|nr:winged helix-turn-helix domain-containing protein [Legionella adelaidensis]KTC65282.1 response regulator [Legionella adelaidensis]VEH81229.1 response regulator [Legionella adelaidensis]
MLEKLLFYIDKSPLEDAFLEYFTQCGFRIIQQASDELPCHSEQIIAIVMKYSPSFDTSKIKLQYRQFQAPIIVISDFYAEDICIKMLEEGADDFLVKPFHPRELHARIKVIKRRLAHVFDKYEQEKEIIRFANWRLYPGSRQIFYENNEIFLSTKEYDILLAFVSQPNKPISRELLQQIAKNNEDAHPFDRRVDVLISRLRQKIGIDNTQKLIQTVRHNGYMLVAEVTRGKE